jgi:uracil-DNA glycosylase
VLSGTRARLVGGQAPTAHGNRALDAYLLEELRLVGPRLLLLVGGTAHRFAFGPAARLDELVGRELAWEAAPGASVLCLPHPSGASTWLNDPARVELWRSSIRLLHERWESLEP